MASRVDLLPVFEEDFAIDGLSAEVLRERLTALRGLAGRLRQLEASAFALAFRASRVQNLRAAVHDGVEDFFALLPETPSGDGDLQDLCALVRADLRAEHQTFMGMENARGIQAWHLVVAGLSLASKTLKAVVALENAWSQAVGEIHQLGLEPETRTALRVRQAYCAFWRSLPHSPPQGVAEVRRYLHESAFSIARLTDGRTLLDLRHADRRLLVTLKRRVRVWLRSRGAAENGACLVQELVAFGGLLAEINHRSELIEHDQRAMKLLAALAEEEPANLDLRHHPAARMHLAALIGRDNELDDLLLAPAESPLPAARLREIAARHLHDGRRPGVMLENVDTEIRILGEMSLVLPPPMAANDEPAAAFAFAAGRATAEAKKTGAPAVPIMESRIMSNIRESLEEAMRIDGAIATALVDYNSGMCLGTAGGNAVLNIEVAAAGNTAVVRAKMKVMKDLGLKDGIEDILITLGKQYHLILPLAKSPNLFIYLATERDRGNLALARHKLHSIEEKLEI